MEPEPARTPHTNEERLMLARSAGGTRLAFVRMIEFTLSVPSEKKYTTTPLQIGREGVCRHYDVSNLLFFFSFLETSASPLETWRQGMMILWLHGMESLASQMTY